MASYTLPALAHAFSLRSRHSFWRHREKRSRPLKTERHWQVAYALTGETNLSSIKHELNNAIRKQPQQPSVPWPYSLIFLSAVFRLVTMPLAALKKPHGIHAGASLIQGGNVNDDLKDTTRNPYRRVTDSKGQCPQGSLEGLHRPSRRPESFRRRKFRPSLQQHKTPAILDPPHFLRRRVDGADSAKTIPA
jgi:hypothetical protein